MHVLPTPQALSEQFGSHWLSPALFYADPGAIRIELGIGDDRLAYHSAAVHRATTVLEWLFRDADDAVLCLTMFCYGAPYEQRALRALYRELRDLNLPRPGRGGVHVVPGTEPLLLIMTPLAPENFDRVAWGAVSYGLGMGPSLCARVRVLSPEAGLIASIYDDRGMDVAGPNVGRMRECYMKFHDWLLDYDRAEMDRRFGEV